MNANMLETLGFSKEELQEKLLDRLVQEMNFSESYDDEDNKHLSKSNFDEKLHEMILKKIDEKVLEMAKIHVFPKIDSIIENLVVQKTNNYGEKKGESKTFVEYMIESTQNLMMEKVDNDGRGKGECNRYDWKETDTRISFMINRYLKYSVEEAMKNVMINANKTIAGGIADVVKLKLKEWGESLSLQVMTTKR